MGKNRVGLGCVAPRFVRRDLRLSVTGLSSGFSGSYEAATRFVGLPHHCTVAAGPCRSTPAGTILEGGNLLRVRLPPPLPVGGRQRCHIRIPDAARKCGPVQPIGGGSTGGRSRCQSTRYLAMGSGARTSRRNPRRATRARRLISG
jgi:hypothetical protein